jgi:hypothetical protein
MEIPDPMVQASKSLMKKAAALAPKYRTELLEHA